VTGALNSETQFGWVTRLLHWAIAIGILAMFVFGNILANMKVTLDNYHLYGLHKSFGLLLLTLIVIRIIWHIVSRPPESLTDGMPAWQLRASKWTHRALYALMVIIPIAGWVASSATGIDVVIFGRWTVPHIVVPSEAIETTLFFVHKSAAWILVGFVALHVAGALKRHFGHRDKHGDRTLLRMIKGR
jgi:cytochrome b561